MEVKFCSSCSQSKGALLFSKGQSRCKECMSAWHKNHYATNAEYRLRRNEGKKARAEKSRKLIQRYKRFCGCKVCGEREPVALDLHHTDPSSKEVEVSKTVNYSREILKKEVRKCVVLCANCHRKVHAGIIEL